MKNKYGVTCPVQSHFRFSTRYFSLAILVALVLIVSQSSFAALPDHSWHGTTDAACPAGKKPYCLTDLDNFLPGDYGYSKWGNLLDSRLQTLDPTILTFSKLTNYITPFNNDLFLNCNLHTLYPDPVTIPPTALWTAPSDTAVGTLTLNPGSSPWPCGAPLSSNATASLFRELHFDNTLIDLNGPMGVFGSPVDNSTRKAIILIHGWNRTSLANSYTTDETEEFKALVATLRSELAGTEWSLILYHWEADADTGGLLNGVGSQYVILPSATSGARAAEIAHQHGQHLGELLANRAPNLEKVHFIAHSAGSWAARSANLYLALKPTPGRAAPLSQITLLDPFIPSTAIRVGASGLGLDQMNKYKVSDGNNVPYESLGSIYRLENYWAYDFATGTNNPAVWSAGGKGINQRIDIRNVEHCVFYCDPEFPSIPGKGHSQPIQFYADSITERGAAISMADSPLDYPERLQRQYNLDNYGWSRSIFYNEPQIVAQPTSTQASVGATAIFTVKGKIRGEFLPTAGLNFYWQSCVADTTQSGGIRCAKIWQPDLNLIVGGVSGDTLTINNVTAGMNGMLFRAAVWNEAGEDVSQTAALTVSGVVAPPVITQQPQSQAATAGARVVLSMLASGSNPKTYQWQKNGTDISGATLSDFVLASVSTSDAGNYTARVSNSVGSATSATATLTVSSLIVPVINNVSPAILQPLPSTERQTLTILGSGFTSNSKLEFKAGSAVYSNRIPTYINTAGTELRYDISAGIVGQNWTVKVINGSAVSNTGYFSVSQASDTFAPSVAITTPTSASTYSATAGSVVLGGTVSDNIGISSVTWNNNQGGSGNATVAGNIWTASSVPLVSGVNVLTMRAFDAAGNSGTAQLSVSYNPTTPSTLPSSPTLQDIVTSNGNYTVAWGPIAGATLYVLEEDMDGTFLHATRFSTTYLSLAFSNKGSGTYYYRVSAVNASGQGPASLVKSAVVAYNQGPAAIIAATPADGAVNQALTTTLSWTASHLGGEGLRFNVYFVPADTEFFYPNNIVSRGQTATSFQVTNLPYNTRVSWGVEAIDDTGDVRFSRMFHFATRAYTTPSTGSVSINAGAATTTSYSVILNITSNPPANGIRQYMRFSNDGASWGDWHYVSPMFPWNLTDYNYGGKAGLTTYTVYAKFRDDQGNESSVYTDTIAKVAGTAGSIILNGKFYETIQDAINLANPGETVYLTEGVFTPTSMDTPNPLRPHDPDRRIGVALRPGVALKGAGPSKTTINFQDVFFGLVDADNATIEGIDLVNSTVANSTITTVLLERSSSRIHNCIIRGGYYGIQVGWNSLRPAVNTQISNNLIINNSQGIFFQDSSNVSITHNTIAYNTPLAGVSTAAGSTTLRNNIIAFNGYQVGAVTGTTIGNNDVYFSTSNSGYSGVANQTGINGNISADPLFVNPSAGNYQLSAGSPAVNAGANIGVPFSGSAPDMGAFEQNATGSMQVNANQAGASFVIAGPQGSYSGSGTAWSSAILPVGLYTISFGSLQNLYSPAYQAIELLSGQALVVTANYSADTTPPVGSVAVNYAEYATEDANASLVLDIEDAVAGMGSGALMKFSNDGVTWSTPEPYSTLKKAWNLAVGYGATNASGLKTVYAMVSDALGNWATFTDTVLYVPNRQVLNVPAQFSTIQAAVNAAQLGDVVQIAPGTFCGNVTLLDGVTLRGSGRGKTVFQGCGVVSSINTAPNSQIEGIGGYIWVNSVIGPTVIQNNMFSSSSQQVVVTGVGKIIRNNIFYTPSDTQTGIGVMVDGGSGATEVVVENNSFINLRTALQLAYARPTTKVFSRGNIFASNNIAVVEDISGDTVHKHIFSSFNTYWANIKGNFGELDSWYKTANRYRLMEAGDMNADPLFTNVSTADFHLQAVSTSMNSGNPEARYADVDLSRNDRGAYGGQKAAIPSALSIVIGPQSQFVADGTSVTLSVKTAGSMPLAYQWSKNGTDIPGATAQTIVLNNVSSSDVGIYTVTVTNQLGSVTSLPSYVALSTPVVVPTYSLNVTAINGAISKNPDRLNYQEGEIVILTAYPPTGYQFTGWSGDVSGVKEQLTLTMNATKNVTASFVDVATPSIPVSLTAKASGATQVELSWLASTDNAGVTSYKVYRDGVLVGNPASAYLAELGLLASTTYGYTVAACDAAGNCSAQSAATFVTTLATVPSAPVIGTATSDNQQVTLTFSPPASNGGSPVVSYTATCYPGAIATTGAASPLTVTGLTNGATYTCSVTAENAIGTSPASAGLSVTPSTTPVTTTPSTVTFGFEAAGYGVNETVPTVTFNVIRGGDPTVVASVDYATSDGTATAGNDYIATSGKLRFDAGETVKTFTLTILDDALVEFDESVNLTLVNPIAGSLGNNNNITLTVVSDDVATGAANLASAALTVAGANVIVKPDANSTIKFAGVTPKTNPTDPAGTTSINQAVDVANFVAAAGGLPAGATALFAYDISTTAVYTGTIDVCLNVPSVNDATEFSNLRIYHGEAGTLVDRTITLPDALAPDFATRRICARVTSLSPFVIAKFSVTSSGIPPVSTDSSASKSSGCFIATAAFGSYLDPHVMVLREFRDHYLLTNSVGRVLVDFYYETSPPIADFIKQHEAARVITRWMLTPVVYAVESPIIVAVIFLVLCLVIFMRRRICEAQKFHRSH